MIELSYFAARALGDGVTETNLGRHKKMKGTKNVNLWRTKLDKSRRILWEPSGNCDNPGALIWNVVKHDAMRREAWYIDNAPRPGRGTRDEVLVDYWENSRANVVLHRYRVPARLLHAGERLPTDISNAS